MSVTMDDSIKRWTAKRKTALVIEIIQGKTTVAEASRSFDLSPSEIEGWVDDAKRGMENSLRANPLDIREQYEKQLKDLQEAYGEAMLELRALSRHGSFIQPRPEPIGHLRLSAPVEQSPGARNFHCVQRVGRLRWPGAGRSLRESGSQAQNAAIVDQGRHQLAGMGEVAEQGLVQKLVPHPAVEALDKSILRGLSGRDVVPFGLLLGAPLQDRVRGQFRPIVGNDHPGPPAPFDQRR